jgi:predicted anti-sigma-YlaC factor YlaD
MTPRVFFLGPILLAALFVGCSPATMGMNRMADALSATAVAYARDDDPELVRAGAPATLKMVEMMLDGRPGHSGLLMTACSGFVQYSYAFLHVESELVEQTDPRGSRDLRDRAVKMYSRGRGYCLRALAASRPRLSDALIKDPKAALTLLDTAAKADVPALYWTAVAWGAELSLASNQLLRVGEIAIVRALLTRALALDETWERGAVHEALIAMNGLPALVGGSPARARQHFERATALSEGNSALPYVTFASSVAQPARNRGEFEQALKRALAVDVSRIPDLRLANLIAQKRARFLLANAERLLR